MQTFVALVSSLQPRLRRSVIMMMDIIMVIVAVPLSLLLSNSNLTFDPWTPIGILLWFAVGLFGHVLFRLSGLYKMMWRFASTPDFFNIFKNCATLAITLYLIVMGVRMVTFVTGLNERQFIVFFLMTFVFISSPRLIYRYLREGRVWSLLDGGTRPSEKRALFLGGLDEADIIISFARSSIADATDIVGIVAPNESATVGAKIQGVPIVGDQTRARQVVDEYLKDTESLDLLIFGQGADKEFADFPELVRIARQHGIAVEQFSGLSQMRRSGKLVLEKVEMETILRRTTVSADRDRLGAFVSGKRVLVTGGAGSIGRTLVKRALDLDAEIVLVADISEFNIFQLQSDLDNERCRGRLLLRIVDICDARQFSATVRQFKPDIIFHAAALKHVPLLEENWVSAVKTNVIGTRNCVAVAAEHGVPHFVLISSDKAADPTSVLGLTKRVAEQIVSAMHSQQTRQHPGGALASNFTGVRFGNVFGSDGSVSTVFQKQIAGGGPVTITDPAMTRYFMTIGEAVDLVIMSAAVSSSKEARNGQGIYMLDMGKPVPILEVAETMIRLAGKKPYQDIRIVISGRRPGEKLHEVLCSPGEEVVDIGVPSIFGLRTHLADWVEVEAALDELVAASVRDDRAAAIRIMKRLSKRTLNGENAGQAEPMPGRAVPEIGLAASADNVHRLPQSADAEVSSPVIAASVQNSEGGSRYRVVEGKNGSYEAAPYDFGARAPKKPKFGAGSAP